VGRDDVSDITRLCALAEERARSLGHTLGPWKDPDQTTTASRHARCSVCGRVVYVRVEDGLLGVAGEAWSERCAPAE
jgi:hypothetical protein